MRSRPSAGSPEMVPSLIRLGSWRRVLGCAARLRLFSLGNPACAGKAMAYMELSLTVAKVLWCFDFHSASGEAGELGGGYSSGGGTWVWEA